MDPDDESRVTRYFGLRWVLGLLIVAFGTALADDNRTSAFVDAIRERAVQGVPEGQFLLGMVYGLGVGMEPNPTAAAVWHRKAADQGFASAKSELGRMYFAGEGVPQDYARALTWWREAAEQGDVDALYNLGHMYYIGAGVPKDDSEAISWFRKAAERGVPKALFGLGTMYALGEGVPPDDVRAYAWINVAVARAGDDEDFLENEVREVRESLGAGMTAVQVAEAQALSRELDERIPRLEVSDLFGQALVEEMFRAMPGTGKEQPSALP